MKKVKATSHKNSFSKLITRGMIVLSIIPLLIFGLFSLFFILHSTRTTGQSRLTEAINSAHSIIGPQITSFDDQLYLLSKDEQLISILQQDEVDYEEIDTILNKMYTILGNKTKDITLHLVDADTNNNFSTRKAPKMYNYPDFNSWGVLRFAQNRTGNKVYPNHYQWSNGVMNAFTITKYVHDEDQTIIGLLIMDFSKEYLQTIMRSIQTTQFGNVQFLLTSLNGTEIFNATDLHDSEIMVGSDFLATNQKIIESDYTMNMIEDDNLNLRIIGILPNDYLKTNLWLFGFAILFTSIPTLLFAIGMGFVISNRINTPILALASKVKQIRTSDEYQLTEINRQDEVGEIDKAFAQLLNRINQYHQVDIEKREQLRIAEVKALQSQINPHFLYNTLDTIKWKAKLNNIEEIATMITELGTMLKASMDFKNTLVTVREEINLVNSFIYIQRQRTGEAFTYQQQIDKKILDYKIPKFLLQPLIENATIHGLRNKEENGLIQLIGREENEYLIFEVKDNGPGFNIEFSEILENEHAHGVGINNVNKRIKLYYGEDFGLSYKREKDMTCIYLKLLKETEGVNRV